MNRNGGGGCNGNNYNLFEETFNLTQCANAVGAANYPLNCQSSQSYGCGCSGNGCGTTFSYVSSNANMNVDLCLQVCDTINGYTYAGLCE